jgi:putative ATPase
MSDLWADARTRKRAAVEPLAVRLRPRTLDEFVGQRHFLAPGKLLHRLLLADRLTSLLFAGPPGTGKTTLAEVIANHTKAHFERANAALVGVKQIREILDASARRLEADGRRTILFLDEIHRFSRTQQDVLLADVERGLVILIGATTENPYFAVNSALVSRSTVFRFEPLSEEDILTLLRRAIADPRAFPDLTIRVDEEALHHWARIADGDARRALTALETAVRSTAASSGAVLQITLDDAVESIQAKALVYDGTGDEHYDIASAFIKSMRGSDPDAAVYWLARMLEAGEDPRFIARRIAILASEDVGNADPRALTVAASAWELVERVGMPEARIILAQAVTYMASAPKSNAAYLAVEEALADVRDQRTVAVPRHLRDGTNKRLVTRHEAHLRDPGAPEENYVYPHDAADGYVQQDYLGVNRVYYRPVDRGEEAALGARLAALRSAVEPPDRPNSGAPDAPDGGHRQER